MVDEVVEVKCYFFYDIPYCLQFDYFCFSSTLFPRRVVISSCHGWPTTLRPSSGTFTDFGSKNFDYVNVEFC